MSDDPEAAHERDAIQYMMRRLVGFARGLGLDKAVTRRIAERGRYPAIDILKSVSRTLPHCHAPADEALRIAARRILSTYGDMEEMVRLGAYAAGSSADVDTAIRIAPAIETLLTQGKQARGGARESFAALEALLAAPADAGANGNAVPDTARTLSARTLSERPA